jgi:ribosomal protein L3
MMRLWVENEQVPVTLVKIPTQEIVRHKVADKDGYTAIVVGTEKNVDENKAK